jgi:AcrR family transcriptional regulator
MPKRVDHEERRREIADALLRLLARDGLEAVSLRHVGAEARVTAGMVQHYFPSKDAMLAFAMRAASERYEQRIGARIAALGDAPDARRLISTLLGGLLPDDDAESDDARIALAFQSYVAHRPIAREQLADGNAQLRTYLAELLSAAGAPHGDLAVRATALLATAEGLAVQILSAGLAPEDARRALEHQIDLAVGAP